MAKTRITKKKAAPVTKAVAKKAVAKNTNQALPVNRKKAKGNKKQKSQTQEVKDLSANDELAKIMKENKRL